MTKPVISLVGIETAPADIREAAEKHLAKGYAMSCRWKTIASCAALIIALR